MFTVEDLLFQGVNVGGEGCAHGRENVGDLVGGRHPELTALGCCYRGWPADHLRTRGTLFVETLFSFWVEGVQVTGDECKPAGSVCYYGLLNAI